MKRLFLLSFLALLATLECSYATTVTFSASGGRVVQDANSLQIANGSLVWVGTFQNTSFTFNPTLSIAQNIAAIESAGGWNQFTLDTSTGQPDASVSNTVTIGGLAGGGRVTGAITDDNSGATKADFFNGKTIYLWVFNSTSTATATQMGIFTGGNLSTPTWQFANNNNGVGDGVTVGTDSTSTPNMVAVGGTGSVTSTNLKLVAAVPEPSTLTILAGATGLLTLLRRRRPSRW